MADVQISPRKYFPLPMETGTAAYESLVPRRDIRASTALITAMATRTGNTGWVASQLDELRHKLWVKSTWTTSQRWLCSSGLS